MGLIDELIAETQAANAVNPPAANADISGGDAVADAIANIQAEKIAPPDSSLKIEEDKLLADNLQAEEDAKIVSDAKIAADAGTSKSFEDMLNEKSGGKYKKFEDIETILAPKDSEFANDYIKNLNELAKKGVEFNEEFWQLQSKDFKAMTDPEQVLLEAMRLNKDYKGWTEKELRLELDDKYKRKEWADEGDEPNDVEILARKRYIRDAEADRERLIEKQQSTSVKTNKPTQAEIEANKESQKIEQANWEKFIDEDVIGKSSKLSTLIDEKTKESFDYQVSDSDTKEIAKVMKGMRTDINLFWNQFKNAEGQFDYKQIHDLLVFKKNKDEILKIVAQNYKAKGAEEEVKRIKNINFKTDGTQAEQKRSTHDRNTDAVTKSLLKK